MLPPLVESFLRGLRYPRYDAAMDLGDADQLRSLVGWLENTKIRLYPAGGAERLDLASADAAVFQAALAKYLSDLECPFSWSAALGPESLLALQWLLSHAGKWGAKAGSDGRRHAAVCRACSLCVCAQPACPPAPMVRSWVGVR